MMNVIKVEARRESRKTKIKGIEFHVAVSPFFFPDRLEYDYDDAQGLFIINFTYLDDEPAVQCPESDDLIVLSVGEHTGRLLSVAVQVDKHDLDHVKLLVVDRISKAIHEARENKPAAMENFDVAGELIKEHAEEIAEAVLA